MDILREDLEATGHHTAEFFQALRAGQWKGPWDNGIRRARRNLTVREFRTCSRRCLLPACFAQYEGDAAPNSAVSVKKKARGSKRRPAWTLASGTASQWEQEAPLVPISWLVAPVNVIQVEELDIRAHGLRDPCHPSGSHLPPDRLWLWLWTQVHSRLVFKKELDPP